MWHQKIKNINFQKLKTYSGSKKREEIDQETCKKCIEHVKRIEEEFYKSDRITDVAVEKLEININPNSDSEMSDMSDLSESDDE